MLFYIPVLIWLIALIWSVLMKGFNSIIIMFVRFWPCRWALSEKFLSELMRWAGVSVMSCQRNWEGSFPPGHCCDVLICFLRSLPHKLTISSALLTKTLEGPKENECSRKKGKKYWKQQPFKHLPESLPLTQAVGDYSIQRELSFKVSLKNNCPWWRKTVTLSTRTKPDLKWVVCLWTEGKRPWRPPTSALCFAPCVWSPNCLNYI